MHAESDLNTSPESLAESDLKASLNQTSTNTGIDSDSFLPYSKRAVFCGQLFKQPFKCPPGGVMHPRSLVYSAQPVLRQAAKWLKRGPKAFLLGNEGGRQGSGTWHLLSLNKPEWRRTPRTPWRTTAASLRPGIRWQVSRQPASGPRQALCHAPCWRSCLHQNGSPAGHPPQPPTWSAGELWGVSLSAGEAVLSVYPKKENTQCPS